MQSAQTESGEVLKVLANARPKIPFFERGAWQAVSLCDGVITLTRIKGCQRHALGVGMRPVCSNKIVNRKER